MSTSFCYYYFFIVVFSNTVIGCFALFMLVTIDVVYVNTVTQYFHNVLLDVLAKIMQFGVYTFFLSCSAAEFCWTEIIQVNARQYGEVLTDEQVNVMD